MNSKRIKSLINFMKGNTLNYIFAIIGTILAAFISLIPPYILGGTIDSIIGSKKYENNLLRDFFNILGGREHLQKSLYLISAVIIFLHLFTALGNYIKVKYSNKASEGIAKNIRRKLFEHLMKLPFAYHSNIDTGDVIQRCTSDIETIRAFLSMQLIEVSTTLFTIIFVFVSMISLNIKMTVISLILLPILVVFTYIYFKKIQSTFKESDEKEGALSNALQENLNAVRVVKAFGREKFEALNFDKKNLDYKNTTTKLVKSMAAFWSMSDLTTITQQALLLIVGTVLTVRGELTVGILVTFITYESMILWPVKLLGRILSEFGKTMVSIERIQEILDNEIEVLSQTGKKPNLDGDIEFKGVSFGYHQKYHVLKNISFSIKKGSTLAILGPTGSGKSTLIHLLQRLFEYDEGSITINGIELKEIDKKWLRENIGIVLQEPFLFSKTIKENLTVCNQKATKDHIAEAARIANLDNVISKLDKGIDTKIGEKGTTLSGGQKQRLAIARTIILDKPILIFDDSLSAVDTKTDALIRKELNEKAKNTTTIIISHRVTTLKDADNILVLEGGHITQFGHHDKLINENGLYKRIWKMQSSLIQDKSTTEV